MTLKGNWGAIITNGTAILGLGDIGSTGIKKFLFSFLNSWSASHGG